SRPRTPYLPRSRYTSPARFRHDGGGGWLSCAASITSARDAAGAIGARPQGEEGWTGTEMRADRSQDVARTTLQLFALGTLIAGSCWILRPFLVAVTWATIIVVATWPLLVHAQVWLWGRRSLAVAAMTITLLLILVVPLYIAIDTIVENADRIARREHGASRCSGGSSRRAGRRRHGGRPVRPRRDRARARRRALREDSDRVDVHPCGRAGGRGARADRCSGLGLCEERRPVGERLPRMGDLLRNARQFPAPDADQARGRPAAPADLRGGDRRSQRLRRHRPLHRARGAGGGVHAAGRLGDGGRSNRQPRAGVARHV